MIFRSANEIRLFRAKLKRCLNFLIRNFKCQDVDLKKRKKTGGNGLFRSVKCVKFLISYQEALSYWLSG